MCLLHGTKELKRDHQPLRGENEGLLLPPSLQLFFDLQVGSPVLQLFCQLALAVMLSLNLKANAL